MPDVQKKKINSGAIIALVFLGAIVGISFLKIDFWIKIAADVAIALILIFIRRGYIFLAIGAKAFRKGDYDKAWPNLEKALKAGLDHDRRNMIGSAYIQQGDAARGVQILEDVIGDPKAGDHRNVAIVTCSMGYWRLGLVGKAIGTLEELRSTGYMNDNLSINLETYLLETGDLTRFRKIMESDRGEGTENNGLMDNRGWYCILTGDWDTAKEVFDELIDERNAKFPEAYLHGAQVSIHNGNVSQAVDRLGWGLARKFTLTCLATKEYFEHLLLGLENPGTRDAFAAAMDKFSKEVSLCKEFPGYEKAVEFDESDPAALKPSKKPTYREQIASTDAREVEDREEMKLFESDKDINTDVEDDDREPNTDLDDDDLAMAVSYGDTTPLANDSDNPDTSVSDDDDREPNTDLDEDEEN